MQRLYSTFPGRWQGIALLLLRAAVGVTLILQGCTYLPRVEEMSVGALAACVLAIASGGALVVGFLTPVACAFAALAGFSIAVLFPSTMTSNFLSSNPLGLDLLIMIVASVLLGPGAFSLDARLFGRRKIVIPRPSNSQAPLSSPSIPARSSTSNAPVSSSSRPLGSSPSRPPEA